MTEISLILTCFIVSLLSVPLITHFSDQFHIVDTPSARKIHTDRIPLLGGVGIFIGYVIAILLVGDYSNQIIFYLIGSIIIIITGIVDDIKSLHAGPKLVGQILAATVVIFFADIRFEITSGGFELLNHPTVSILLTYLWIVGVTNALNLVDGMDGLAGGISFIALGAIAVAAQMKGLELYFLISIGLMGSVLGFLRYNIPPAKVFMGDTGSLFLGFNIAVLSLVVSHKSGTVLSVLVPLMFVSLPVFDTFLAIVRRTLQKKNPMSADKEHLHHRLLELEFSPIQSLIIFYSLSILLSIIPILTLNRSIVWGVVISVTVLYLFLLSLRLLHVFDMGSKIRCFNEKLHMFAVKVTTGNAVFDMRVKVINSIIALMTLILLFYSIILSATESYPVLVVSVLFLGVLVFMAVYRNVLHIKNEFLSFTLFWLFFYISYTLIQYGETQFLLAVALILSACIVLKIMIRKRFDLFISNPMEFLILFCLILLKLSIPMETDSFLLVSTTSFIIYYANKVYFTREYQYYKHYMVIVCFMVLMFPMKMVYSAYDNVRINKLENVVIEQIYITPNETRRLMNAYYKAGEFEKGRELLLYVERFSPIWKIKDVYRYEAGKLYSRLILDSLFSGNLKLSAEYVGEYVDAFPEMVEEFYAVVEPVIRNANRIQLKDVGDIKIHNHSLVDIVEAYSGILDTCATKYQEKGFAYRSKKFTDVSKLLKDLIS